MEPYYYLHMSKVHQSAYHAMKAGLQSLAPSFPVPRLEGRELADIFFRLRLDCPEIFWATGFHYRFYPDSTNVEFIPEYLFDKAKVKDHQKAMTARVEKLVRGAKTMSEWEKEQYIHDFICQNVRYDKLKKPYSHEIIGPLGQGVGVCEGIAKTVKILCDALGIWCIIAISDANPDKQIKYRHAWNVIRIGGKYYHLDATFDNSLCKSARKSADGSGEVMKGSANGSQDILRYDYFNLDDKHFFRDHEPVIWKVPACTDGDHFYYKEKKISFTKVEDVKKRSQQAIRKGKTLLFHWRGGYLTREVLAELLEAMAEAAREKGKYAKVSLNWPQAVLYVTFEEEAPQEEFVAEEANEGEKL